MEVCYVVDCNFLDDEQVCIENGKLIIGKSKVEEVLWEIEVILELLQDWLEKINLLDFIINVECWLLLYKLFGFLLGFEFRVDDLFLCFVLMLFCYGMNIGFIEMECFVCGISCKQVVWFNFK